MDQGIVTPAQKPPVAIPAIGEALFELLARCYGFAPPDVHCAQWLAQISAGMPADKFIRWLVSTPGFSLSAPGTFNSPMVNLDDARPYLARERQCRAADVKGITFDLNAMAALWQSQAAFIAATPFSEQPDGVHRYSFLGGPYNYGDAITLRMLMNAFRPRRIVEIGSGHSTACMLDTADEIALDPLSITCVEPFPVALRSLLRPEDFARVAIVEQQVQGLDLALFASLKANDILFIDSSHVLKTGSDVHYELFHILPELAPGVLVHFHDCRWPFEYSDRLIFEQRKSWNEAYGVRALLMHSTRFEVLFYNSLFALEREAEAQAVSPDFMRNPGSAIWLRVKRRK